MHTRKNNSNSAHDTYDTTVADSLRDGYSSNDAYSLSAAPPVTDLPSGAVAGRRVVPEVATTGQVQVQGQRKDGFSRKQFALRQDGY